MNANELKNIEINYKASARHNNYVYKSKEECAWNLYQISNCSDIIKSILLYMENMSFKSLDQAVLHVDHLIELINQARDVLIFPKKRNIQELQTQKNMKIFPLVPNDLVFSFYIQGFKLILAIYIVKGAESTKHVLECNSIEWLNNVMILLTTCLQKMQQMKDKLNFFEQINIPDYDWDPLWFIPPQYYVYLWNFCVSSFYFGLILLLIVKICGSVYNFLLNFSIPFN